MPIIRELITKFTFKADQNTLNRIDRKLMKVGNRMKAVGRGMTMFVTAPLALAGLGILKVAGDFESGMNRVQAITSATGEEFQLLRNQAKLLGKTTVFTATQVANAMGFLAQAGFSVNEIYASMPATLNLAAAAQQDMATTADQLSNIMRGFGLEADQSGRASDVLTKAAISSNTNITQLAEAMKFAAPVANLMGVSLERTAAMMGFMGNAGIQASMAGTTTRRALLQLVKMAPEAQDAFKELGIAWGTVGEDGKNQMRDIFDLLQDLEEKGASTKQLEAIFGARGIAGIGAILQQGVGNLREFTEELENSTGTAERIAKVRMKGLFGALKLLKSALEGLAIAIGDSGILQFFTNMIKSLAMLIRKLEKVNPVFLRWSFIIGGVLASAGPLLIVLGLITTALGAMSAASLGVTAMVAGIALAIIGLILIIEDLYVWMKGGESLIGRFLGDFNDDLPIFDNLKNAALKAMELINAAALEMFGAWGKIIFGLDPGKTWFQHLEDTAIGKFIERIEAMIQAIKPLFARSTDTKNAGVFALPTKEGVGRDLQAIKDFFTPNLNPDFISPDSNIGAFGLGSAGAQNAQFDQLLGNTTINVMMPEGTRPEDADAVGAAVGKAIAENNDQMLRKVQINTPTEEG